MSAPAPIRFGSPMHRALRHLEGGTLPCVAGGRFRKAGRAVSADRAAALVGNGLAAFRVDGKGRATGLSLTPAGDAELARLRGPAP